MNVVGTQMDRLSQNRPSWWAHWYSIFDNHWSFWFYPIFCWFFSNFCWLKTSSWAIFLHFAGHEKHNQLRAAYSYWNVANTVPLQAAGWGGFRYRIQKVYKVDPFPPVFDVETLNLGPTWVPGAWKISCSAQWRRRT